MIKPFNPSGRLLSVLLTVLVLFSLQYQVSGQSRITGHLRYLNPGNTVMDGVPVLLLSDIGEVLDTINTDQNGFYYFDNVQAGQYYVEPICGKEWGGANSIDALLAQKHFVGLSFLSGLPLKAADVDNSNAVNSIDALQIMKRFVGMIDYFVAGDWTFDNQVLIVDGIEDISHDFFGLCYGDINGTFTPKLCIPYPSVSDAGPDIIESIALTIPLNANSPISGNGKWQVLSGNNYVLSDFTLPNATFTGLAGQTYLLTWNITTSCFTSVDTMVISFASSNVIPCPGVPSFIYGGQTYYTVQIGNQCWMKENLNIGTMLADYNSDTSTTICADNSIIEKYCYNSDPAYCAEYGGLYDWDELMQYVNTPASQGICPSGWHIPTIDEYDTLINYLQGDTVAGSKLKENGLSHWNAPNLATNETGFSALGAGLHSSYGGTGGLKMVSYFWTSTLETTTESYIKALDNGYAWMWEGYTDKYQGYSVRCLKNDCQDQPSQSDAGPDQTISDTIAQLAGNFPQFGQGSWSIVSGTGGTIAYYYYGNTQFTGQMGNTYTLVWTISTPCNQTTDTVVISFVPPTMNYPCPGIPIVMYGSQLYNTVQIGSQCWMKENLNIGTMVSGLGNQSNDGQIEKYCFNNSPENCQSYGGLYQWDEAMQYSLEPGAQGICPTGWHIPTEAEWCTLLTFLDAAVNCNEYSQLLGINIGGLLKNEGYDYWNYPNYGATNASGFSALGSGYRYPNGQFYGLKVDNYTWSSEFASTTNAFNYSMWVSSNQISHLSGYRENGHAVRCMMNCPNTSTSDAGADQSVLDGTSTNLAGSAPSFGETGIWTIFAGTGGNIADSNNRVSSFNGITGQSYHLIWTISNSCGNFSMDTVVISIGVQPGQPCPGLASFIYEGQTYNTVQVGTQCWMKENLNIGSYIDGNYDQSDDGVIEKYCYDNDPANCAIYGGLYQWDEVMQYSVVSGSGGICPSGFHIPAIQEWTDLEDFLGGSEVAGGKMKESGFEHWSSPNTGATNESGFTALGAGYRMSTGGYDYFHEGGIFWSSSENLSSQAWNLYVYAGGMHIYNGNDNKSFGFSVRCIRDTCNLPPTQSDAGPDQTVIGNTTQLEGSIPQSAIGHWSIYSGTGGVLGNVNDPVSTFTGLADATYKLIWTITNACGSASDTVTIIFISPSMNIPCPGLPYVQDGDQYYNTVKIGSQCWLKENLNKGTMIDGSNAQTNNNTIEKYCYNNNPANCDLYGGFYQWDEVMQYNNVPGTQGLCPFGFHIPAEDEWFALETFLGGSEVASGKMKEAGFNHWLSPNTNATNESGFTALGAGYRGYGGNFDALNYNAYFWSSSESSSLYGIYFGLYFGSTVVSTANFHKNYGFNVRCLKDTCSESPSQSDAGPDQTVLGTIGELTATSPYFGLGTWSIISGTGGVISDSQNPYSSFSGLINTTYELVWTVSTACSSTRDSVNVFFSNDAMGIPCPELPDFIYDGQTYNTVKIGPQCWIKENLNVGTMINGTEDQTDNGVSEKYCQDNNPANCTIYGGLYQWNEMMQYGVLPGAQGICPSGFHVPTDEEFDFLTGLLGGKTSAGGKLKEAGFDHWNSPNTAATNESGFTALGAGYRGIQGDFGNLNYDTYFWTSADYGLGAWDRYLYSTSGNLIKSANIQTNAFSVRCLKD